MQEGCPMSKIKMLVVIMCCVVVGLVMAACSSSGGDDSEMDPSEAFGGQWTLVEMTQDGKTMYLKIKSKVAAEAKIWPDYKYKEFEIVDKGLHRVGFVLQLKAGQTADIEVTMSPERGKSFSLPKINLKRK